ncbi:MAG: hypothetical protein K6G15_11425 [Desulfovibrio sp.]|nr:hypothetical protein [Desulfovibrio sp.]
MRRVFPVLFALSVVLLASSPLWAAAAPSDTLSYNNSRYGFSLALPKGDWKRTEAANGDGCVFTQASIEVRAYGTRSYVVQNQDMEDARAHLRVLFAKIEHEDVDRLRHFFRIVGRDSQGQLLCVLCYFGQDAANIATISGKQQFLSTFEETVLCIQRSFRPGF